MESISNIISKAAGRWGNLGLSWFDGAQWGATHPEEVERIHQALADERGGMRMPTEGTSRVADAALAHIEGPQPLDH